MVLQFTAGAGVLGRVYGREVPVVGVYEDGYGGGACHSGRVGDDRGGMEGVCGGGNGVVWVASWGDPVF